MSISKFDLFDLAVQAFVLMCLWMLGAIPCVWILEAIV